MWRVGAERRLERTHLVRAKTGFGLKPAARFVLDSKSLVVFGSFIHYVLWVLNIRIGFMVLIILIY